jgi:hypothetical protein
MALQKRFNDPRKQFVDCYWTVNSGVLSRGRGRILALAQLVDEPASTVHAGGSVAIAPSRTQL